MTRRLLTFPERVKAIREYANSLERFYDRAWWASSVDDLTFCDVHRKVGPLTKQERGRLNGGDYFYRLFGDHQIRVIMTDDPCFQTGYGGSDPLSSLPDEPSCARYRNRGWVFFDSR